jgi:PAS domain-containing protein
VELSVSEPATPEVVPQPASSTEHWVAAVSGAAEPCLVIDSLSMILAASPSACSLLGFEDQEHAVGRHLFAVRLIDFGEGAALPDSELEKIPPVLARSSGRLARGLLRVQSNGETRSIDAVSTPLFDGKKVVGSLSFLAEF